MKMQVVAVLLNGDKVSGWLTTEHAASSYGQPVFVAAETGHAYNWLDVASVEHAAAELGRKGGQSRSDAKLAAARSNGKKGGRPRKQPPAA